MEHVDRTCGLFIALLASLFHITVHKIVHNSRYFRIWNIAAYMKLQSKLAVRGMPTLTVKEYSTLMRKGF